MLIAVKLSPEIIQNNPAQTSESPAPSQQIIHSHFTLNMLTPKYNRGYNNIPISDNTAPLIKCRRILTLLDILNSAVRQLDWSFYIENPIKCRNALPQLKSECANYKIIQFIKFKSQDTIQNTICPRFPQHLLVKCFRNIKFTFTLQHLHLHHQIYEYLLFTKNLNSITSQNILI